jgi:hypothetical protein
MGCFAVHSDHEARENQMSELTKLVVIISRNLAKALESIASELNTPLSQASKHNFVSPCDSPTSNDYNFVSLAIGVFVLFEHKNGNRYGGLITKIDGENLEIENDALLKTWSIKSSQVFYSRIYTSD